MKRWILLLFVSVLILISATGKATEPILWFPLANFQEINCDFTCYQNHNGIDYAIPEGTALYAPISGQVISYRNDVQGQVCDEPNYGNYIKIRSGNYDLILGHMQYNTVQTYNGNVQAGDFVGYSSNTGYTFSGGSCGKGGGYHVHVELRLAGTPVNPEDYWASNPPRKADSITTPEPTPTPTPSDPISTAYTTSFSTYNTRNARKNQCTGTQEVPGRQLNTSTNTVHWWGYSAGVTPSKSSEQRDAGKYTSLQAQDYTGGCSGAIVFDDWGGANRAYVVQCEHWSGWLSRNGPEGAPTQSYPQDCGMPLTNVYGYGSKWIQDFQDCRITYRPDDGSCVGDAVLKVLPYPKDFSPGEIADGTWNTQFSYLFAEKYESKGASKRLGYPITGVLYNSQRGEYYQEFKRGRTLYFNQSEGRVRVIKTSDYRSYSTFTTTQVSTTTLASIASTEAATIDTENQSATDADQDGSTIAQGDCNDTNSRVYPGAVEIVDGLDNDCDEVVSASETNLDPYPDILVYYPTGGGWWLAKNHGSSATYHANLFQSMYTQGRDEHWYLPLIGNLNGDTYDDLIVYHQSGDWTGILNANGTLPVNMQPITSSYGGSTQYYYPYTGDFNGDGLSDALLYATWGDYYVRLSDGSTYTWSAQDWMSGCDCGAQSFPETNYQLLVGDINGDGMDDVTLYGVTEGRWYGATSNGGNNLALTTWLYGLGMQAVNEEWYHPIIGDINGDGMSDIGTATSAGAWYMALSTGTSFQTQTTWITTGHGSATSQFFLKDMNGDGKDDAVTFESSTGTWTVALSTGSSFASPTTWITDFGTDSTGVYGVIGYLGYFTP